MSEQPEEPVTPEPEWDPIAEGLIEVDDSAEYISGEQDSEGTEV